MKPPKNPAPLAPPAQAKSPTSAPVPEATVPPAEVIAEAPAAPAEAAPEPAPTPAAAPVAEAILAQALTTVTVSGVGTGAAPEATLLASPPAKAPEASPSPTGPSPAAEESKDYALYLTAFALIASGAGLTSLYAGPVAPERRAAILAQAASDARAYQIRPRTKFAEALANLLK